MMKAKLATAALAATLLLAFAVQSASGNTLSTNSERFDIIWNEMSQPLTFAGALENVCVLTLSGTFHSRTLAKTPGLLIGSITHVELSSCSSPTRILEEALPWSVTYEAFAGALPNIASLRFFLIGVAVHIEFNSFAECLFATTAENPIAVEFTTSTGELSVDSSSVIPITDDGPFSFLCEENSLRMAGAASTEDGSGGSLAFTLI